MSAIQRTLVKAVQAALALARYILPPFALKRLSGRASSIVAAIATPVGESFEDRSLALANWRPIFENGKFANGPILFVNTALAWGGAERQLVNTMKGLAQRGIRSNLLCLRLHEDVDLDFFEAALTGHPGFVRNAMSPPQGEAVLASISSETRTGFKNAIGWLPIDVQDEILRFAGEFAAIKPSVVHAWQDSTSIAAAYAAWMIGVPRIVLSARSVAPVNFHYLRPYMANAYRELASCRSVIILNNSEAGADDYARWLNLPRDRFTVLHNGFDAAAVTRPAAKDTNTLRAKLAIPATAPVVGTVIRFSPVKQPMLWIKTASRVSKSCPDCHFVIFGTGPLRDDVLAAAKSDGFADRLHCPGTIDDAALGLSLFDVFLLTSQVEGTPNVVLEAGLLGVPVVATAVGGIAETIVEGVTGRAIVNATSESLAQAVLEFLRDPAAVKRAASEGPAFVERKFGLERMLDETLSIYRGAMA